MGRGICVCSRSRPAQDGCHDRDPPAVSAVHPRDREQKVQAAEDAWNTRDPERVSLAYTSTRTGAIATSTSSGVSRSWRF